MVAEALTPSGIEPAGTVVPSAPTNNVKLPGNASPQANAGTKQSNQMGPQASASAQPAKPVSAQASAESSRPSDIVLSWEKYGKILDELSRRLKAVAVYEKWKYVCGVPRGGLAIAIYLSYQLELPMIDLEKLYIVKGLKILMVNDVSAGNMLLALKKRAEANRHKVFTTTLYLNKNAKFMPDMYIEKTEGWVKFPYEK